MTTTSASANDDCDNIVPPQHGRGRRAICCSPPCRPTATGSPPLPLRVEIDHALTVEGERPTGRIWMVRLRRGIRTVTIASDLGRPSADHLAAQLNELLTPSRREKGAAID